MKNSVREGGSEKKPLNAEGLNIFLRMRSNGSLTNNAFRMGNCGTTVFVKKKFSLKHGFSHVDGVLRLVGLTKLYLYKRKHQK